MNKAKVSMNFEFNWVGWTSLILLLTMFLTLYLIYLITADSGDKIFFLFYGGPFMLIAIVVLWWIVLTEFNTLVITKDKIEFKSLISGRTKSFNKIDLKGYEVEFTRGYSTINLINHKNKTVKAIREIYYKDMPTITKLLQLDELC